MGKKEKRLRGSCGKPLWLIEKEKKAREANERRRQSLKEMELDPARRKPAKQPKPTKQKKSKQRSKSNIQKIASKYADRLIKRATPAELHFLGLLKESGILFKQSKIVYTAKSFYIVDFYISRKSLCVELDGDYHNTPEQKAKDLQRDKYLNSKGYVNWRMTNEEAFKLTVADLVAKINTYPDKAVRHIPLDERTVYGPTMSVKRRNRSMKLGKKKKIRKK